MLAIPVASCGAVGLLAHPSACATLLLAASATASELAVDSCLTRAAAELAQGDRPWLLGLGWVASAAVPSLLAPLRAHAQTCWSQRAVATAAAARPQDTAVAAEAIEVVVAAAEAALVAAMHAYLAGGDPGAVHAAMAGAALLLGLTLVASKMGKASGNAELVAVRATASVTQWTGLTSLALAVAPSVQGAASASQANLLAATCDGLDVLCPLILATLLTPKAMRHLGRFRRASDGPLPRL